MFVLNILNRHIMISWNSRDGSQAYLVGNLSATLIKQSLPGKRKDSGKLVL